MRHLEATLAGAAAIVATHVFGAPCSPEAISGLGVVFNVPVLFDAAHVFGAKANGVPIGRFGNAEVFSLTPTKVLVAGEGGLVATNDDALAQRLRALATTGTPATTTRRSPG